VNYVAHAKAIDKLEHGYFEKYISMLSEETGEKELRPPPDLSDQRYWTPDMRNEQLSNFNQIVAHTAALYLAHFYLGHYQKHAAQSLDSAGKRVPINQLLTPKEWGEAMHCGVQNALDCGMGVEGVIALYECIDKMPQRPAWTIYFLPSKAKFSAIKRDLKQCEKNYFMRR
jgi:hypothetical protein